MIHQATMQIAKALDQNNLKYEVKEMDNISYVQAGFSGKNVKHLSIRYLSTDEDNDVSVRVFQLATAPEEKREKILAVLNSLNRKYRYAKFVIDDDGDVNVQYDIPQKSGNVGEACIEILVRFMQILDDSYPTLMQALWS